MPGGTQQFNVVGNLTMKVDDAISGVNKFKQSLAGLKIPAKFDENLKKSFSNLDSLFSKYKDQLQKGFKTKGDVTGLERTGRQIESEINKITSSITKLTGQKIDFKIDTKALVDAENKLKNLVSQREKLVNELNKKVVSTNKKGDALGISQLFDAMQGSITNGRANAKSTINMAKTAFAKGDIQETLRLVKQLEPELLRLKSLNHEVFAKNTGGGVVETIKTLIQVLDSAEKETKDLDVAMSKAKTNINDIRTEQLNNASTQLNNLASGWQRQTSAIRQATSEMNRYAQSSYSMSSQLGQLKTSTEYFFSLRNMINLFRRGVNDAVQSVKELDKAMTATAVVTKFDVSDMWNMLPQYSKLANELGATTKGAYETMTLYFQQGLDQSQAFQIGAETMKMARIAGLDYAKTTDMMTAALRGFNMELNNISAQRINDVYSNLAAKTASNTEELGSAMERTASIAHSAGMSFEGTSAFLAQMIETTREAPENLGTAMKTIIARFQELKKNPLEIAEVEGEEVDFNKIDAALKTIGVDLVDTNGQFRALDQVFLDISKRWGSLSQMQQRYIATTAAGSRQQSRFIAAMSNYDRTLELMSYANDSAGASQKQFEKTMDSLESKLNKLHNSWELFTMGIANNGMIKSAVGGLTTVLDTVNKLIDTLSFGKGPLKSFLSLFTAFVGLRMGGRLINGLIGGAAGMLGSGGFFKGFFGGGMTGSMASSYNNQAKAIYTPIVAELRALRGEVKNSWQKRSGPFEQYKAFKESRKGIMGITGRGKSYSLNQLYPHLEKLTSENQMRLMKTLPGTSQAINKSIIDFWRTDNNKAGNKQIKNVIDGMKAQVASGQKSYAQFLKDSMNPKVLSGLVGDGPAKAIVEAMNKKITEQANSNLNNREWIKANQKGLVEAQKQAIAAVKAQEGFADLSKKEQFAARKKARLQARVDYAYQKANEGQSTPIKNTFGENVVNNIASFGASVQGAGMALTGLGTTLQVSTNPAVSAFGVALTSAGGTLTSLGMGIGGLSQVFSLFTGSVLGAVAGVATLAAAAIAVGFAIKKNNEKKIREAAEKVTTNYNDKKDSTQRNISNLKSYQSDLLRLSQGVDENGLNVNLDTSDYDRYLEIVDEIAKINPSIVKGYNEQGHAIINNNKALEETLKLEKEREKKAFNEYISDSSTKKLEEALDLERKRVNKNANGGGQMFVNTGGWFAPNYQMQDFGEANMGYEYKTQTKMRKQAQKIGSLLRKGIEDNWFKEEDLSKFSIDLSKLMEGDEEALNNFKQYKDQLNTVIETSMTEAGDLIDEKTSKAMSKAFNEYDSAAQDFDEFIDPYFQQALAKISQNKNFKQIPEEMTSYFNQGLKDIVSNADNLNKIDEYSANLARQFAALSSEGSDYSKVMEEIAEAQDAYADSLDAKAYQKAADKATSAIDDIERKLSDSMDTTKGYGLALVQFLDNQSEKIRRFTEEGATSLDESLNTMTNQIKAAESAAEAFGEATKTDFSTGAENMKSILDEITKETEIDEDVKKQLHMQGKGDNTFWTGAKALLSEEGLKKIYKKNNPIEYAKKELDKLSPMLKEGEEGAVAFTAALLDAKESGKFEGIKGFNFDTKTGELKLDSDINPDVFKQVANALGMSEQFLTSMLNKARQFADISFDNVKEVRKALAADDSVIKGEKEGKRRNLYVERSYLEEELAKQNYTPVEIDKKIKEYEAKQGIKTYTIDELAKNNKETQDILSKMNITDMASAIQVLGDTGRFNKEDIQRIANNFDDYNKEAFGERYQEYIDSQEDPSYSSIQSIEGTTQGIYQILADHFGDNTLSQADKLANISGDGSGTDTIGELFAAGRDSEGNFLTKDSYEQTKAALEKNYAAGLQYVKGLEEQIKEAKESGDTKKAKELQTELDKTTSSLVSLNYEISRGPVTWKNLNDKAAEIQNTKTEVSDLLNNAHNIELNGLYNTKAFSTNEEGKTTLDVNTFKSLIETTKEIYKDTATQSQIFGQYLQNNANDLLENNASGKEIADAISTATQEMVKGGLDLGEAVKAINSSFGTNFTEKNFDANGVLSRNTIDIDSLEEQLQNLQGVVNLTIGTISTNASGQNNHRFGTFARGSKKGYTIPGRPTLTGEEGEELVWEPKRNQAYMVGSNGPQFANISKDAVVWNAAQTKKIKKNSGSVGRFGTGARGITPFGTMALAKGAGGGTGGGSKTINGSLTLDAIANIVKADAASIEPVSVKAKLDFGGESKGGLLNKIKGLAGGNKNGTSVDVTAKVTNFITGEQTKAVDVIGRITDMTDDGSTGTVDAIAVVTSVIRGAIIAGEPVSVQAKATVNTVDDGTGGKGEQVDVSTNFDNSDVNSGVKEINHTTAKITVDADAGKAIARANAAVSVINGKSATIDITTNQIGSGTVYINVKKRGGARIGGFNQSIKGGGESKGTGNRIVASPVPTFASAAKGRLGPNGKGGLTLTGEKGFEIAWIPSESRSMILGAHGPQMLNLPSNAVVYTHEQSKKILKQKSIPAGSHSEEEVHGNFSNLIKKAQNNDNSNNNITKVVTTSTKNTEKVVKKTAKKVEEDSGNATKAVRTVSVWWENIARKTEGAQRKMDKSAEAFEKYIKEMRATLKKTGQSLKSGGGGGDAYIKNIGRVLGYNQKQLKQANKELRVLDKKRHKNVKGGYKKGSVAAMEISYETGKGDKKKTKIDYVNTAGYIKYDKKNGTYVIDQKKLNKIKNKDKRQAVADELNKRLDDEIKKRDAATDAIAKANEALEKMKEELYNTFFGWETELTKIWNLTQQINAITSKIERNKSYEDLLKARFSVDENFSMEEYVEQMLENFSAGIEKQQEKIKKDSDMIDLRRNGLLDLVNQTTDRENLKEVKARLKNDETVSTAKANKEKADERVKKLEAKRKKNLKTLAIYSNAEYQTPAMKKEIQKLEKETAQITRRLKSAKTNQKKANATLKEVQKKYGSSVLNDTERAGYEEYVERTAKQINTRNRAFNYMDVSRNADGTLNIDFRTEDFEKDKLKGKISEEAAKEIQDYVKELVEQSEELDTAINTLTNDLEQQYSDLAELKEQWTDYAKQLWEMSEEEQKQEADRIKKLGDSITKALKDLLDGVKRKIDERRQKEDNAKTERDISQKQQRLAMLRADTAGGHAVEIAQLEKEIAEAQQNYQRTLEDQLLEKLQNQADEASKQREQMISLLETQIENSNNAEKVDMWMTHPEEFEEEIKNAFYAKMAPDYNKMPEALKKDIDKDWKDFWTGITTNQDKQKDLQEKITANAAALDTLKTAAEGLSTVLEKIKAGANVSADTGTGGGKGGGGKENPPITPTKAQQKIIDTFNSGPSALVDAKLKTLVKGKDYSWQSVFEALKLDEKYGGNESAVIQQIHRIFGKKSTRSKAFLDAYQKVFGKAYATGGLANYTGPAWLDGTPTKPELVLNATDTRNFLALKDVLSRAIGAVDSTVSTGDATYEININVDHLNSDYDVDRVAQRVKKIIVNDSSYRNVTQVRNFR